MQLVDGKFLCAYCNAVNLCILPSSPPAPTQGEPGDHAAAATSADPQAARLIEQQLINPKRIAWVRSEVAKPGTSLALDISANPPVDLASMATITSWTTWISTWLPALREHWLKALPAAGQSLTDAAIQHRIYWLALRLGQAYGIQARHVVKPEEIEDSQLRRRAVLETALQHLESTPYASVLRCHLSRAASHAGDLPSARVWLGRCPPDGDDLEVDGEIRIALAAIDATEGNLEGICQILEPGGDEVPFRSEELTLDALAYRIHAHEQLGHGAVAKQLLRSALKDFGFSRVFGRLRMERIAPRARHQLGLRIVFKWLAIPALVIAAVVTLIYMLG